MPIAAIYWAACFGLCGEKENYFQADFWTHSISVKYITAFHLHLGGSPRYSILAGLRYNNNRWQAVLED